MSKLLFLPEQEQDSSKVISIDDIRKRTVYEEAKEVLESLEEDYDLEVTVSLPEMCYVLNRFYEYYQQKEVESFFPEIMIGHLNDMAIDAIDDEVCFDIDFLLDEMILYELLNSPLDVNPEDTKVIAKRLRKELGGDSQ